jgi:hypothetical protein
MKIDIRFQARSCGLTRYATSAETPPVVPIRNAVAAATAAERDSSRIAGKRLPSRSAVVASAISNQTKPTAPRVPRLAS